MKKLILALALIIAADTAGIAQSSTNRQDSTKRERKMDRDNRRDNRNDNRRNRDTTTNNRNNNYNKDYNQQGGTTTDSTMRSR